jgi:type I restriction enzyme M protein
VGGRETSENVAIKGGMGLGQPSMRMGPLTQGELESRLLDAANSLRGPVDPADFKAYVFPLLFFKWISDTWEWEQRRALDVYGGDAELAALPENYRFVIPEGCHWSDLRKISENVGVALQNILDRLQAANPDKLAGIFGDVAWGNKERLPEPALLNLIDTFTRLDLNPEAVPHDMLGNAYEYLLREFADESGKKAGEFFTPRAVVRLMVRILDPQPGETVYDPACGSGGMLVEAIGEVREAGGDPRTLRLYAQEVNLTTAAIARMNLYLHEIEDFAILRGDTLRDPKFRTGQGLERFDVVIANPPFSLKKWGAEVWRDDPWHRSFCGVPPANTADFAWVQHMVTSMRAGTGRLAVVMPHGVLFRGAVEAQIRRCLVERGTIEAVVSLPPNLFYSTSIPACVLVCRATPRAGRQGGVLFVDGSKRFTKGRNQNHMSAEDVEVIVTAYASGDGNGADSLAAQWVDRREIEENGWDLNIGRYIKGAADEVLDVETALEKLGEAQTSLHEAESRLAERLREAGYA